MPKNTPWTRQEVDLIIPDYFSMLHDELNDIDFVKAHHNKKLRERLDREKGSVERKHQNISAILIKNGYPWIDGYKPLDGFQRLLEERVLDYVTRTNVVRNDFEHFAEEKVSIKTSIVDFSNWEVKPPRGTIKEIKPRKFIPRKRDYLQREQENSSVGEAGEKLVFESEKRRLIKEKCPKLAEKVEWISKDKGDGAGYDILSWQKDGREKYIEVKTTKLGLESPFYFSEVENDFSKEFSNAFFLYRVFEIKKFPKMFWRQGSFEEILMQIQPVQFRGFF
jgi:hypothetical protein